MSPERGDWQPTFLLLSCEHAGREIPDAYMHLFASHQAVLETHRGYDLGAFAVAQRMAAVLFAPLHFTTVSRLLADTNRSPASAELFGDMVQGLNEEERARIVESFHAPHRRAVAHSVAAALEAGHQVLHVAVHSFTSNFGGQLRELDVALLFDPQRASESSVSERWLGALQQVAPALRWRFNEPYHGTDDGLTTTLRERFGGENYAGMEVEIRQELILTESAQRSMAQRLAETLAPLLHRPAGTF